VLSITHIFGHQTFLVLISANILVVGAAIYGRIERRTWKDSITRPNTFVIELTRISTSHWDSSLTRIEDDLDNLQEDSIMQDPRPLFWSLVERREREDIELSAVNRMTV